MKTLMRSIGLIFIVSIFISCSKETEVKENIELGLLCDPDRDIIYSEWCISNTFKYHIGYPNIPCFDSMLISFPVINDWDVVRQYGNHPIQSTVVFYDYYASSDSYRIYNHDCLGGGETLLRYQMFVDRVDLLDPATVDALFYFYGGNASLPTDSIIVEFKPWN